jgi:phosphoribosylaminoimidazolecarboxamide formyltransferase/IMP cyclohydrolase
MNTPENHKIKTALLSVSDKTNIVEFAKELVAMGVEIYSTGGTKKTLLESGIKAKSISELTSFPEIMGGRVKTLHPIVHGGLLADLGNEEHISEMTANAIKSIDLVVINLYPFEQTLKNANSSHADLIENIDIGGPAMLRASAKNYKWTFTVINPSKYNEVVEILKANNTCVPLEVRKEFAAEVFSLTAYYDAMISNYFNTYNGNEFPNNFSIGLKKEYSLRYGENPFQSAALYSKTSYIPNSTQKTTSQTTTSPFSDIFEKLHGKELSYNNILDIDAASRLILEFVTEDNNTTNPEYAVAIIKHTNPCGVGIGDSLIDAYNKAFATDTVSPFGGILAFTHEIDLATAEVIHSLFAEVLIAPNFTPEAFELLSKKKDRRLIKANYELLKNSLKYEVKSVAGGILIQSTDDILYNDDELKIVTKRQPTADEMQGLMFAWKVSKHIKSNAILFASKDRTLGIGAGQMSRVDSSRIATEKAKLMNIDLKGSLLASDAFFPFADGLLQAVEMGVTAVIQPGGSVRDEEVIKAADDNNIAMIFTGSRHFKH